MFRAFSQFSAIDEGSVGTAILDEGEVARGSAIARQLEMDFRIGFVKRVRYRLAPRRSFGLLQNYQERFANSIGEMFWK